MDFFAGSGSTAHAVLESQKRGSRNKSFVLVQLPEPTGIREFPTISDITKERVRRVIKKLDDEDSSALNFSNSQNRNRGFRVFKLAESNFKEWNADMPHDANVLEEQLTLHIEHLREGRSSDDLLYELLLKSGFVLTTPVEKVELGGKTVYSVASGALLICLELELTLDLIRAMAKLESGARCLSRRGLCVE